MTEYKATFEGTPQRWDTAALNPPTTEDLLSLYARKPVRRFAQHDGFSVDTGAFSIPSERTKLFPEGCDIFLGASYDLRSSGPDLAVRVQIAEGANREQVLFLLGQIRDNLVADWENNSL